MQSTLSPTRTSRKAGKRRSSARSSHSELGRYVDDRGCLREVISQAGLAGTVLVIDRDARKRSDGRLLAHLAADEPVENAALICRLYLQDTRGEGKRCRALSEDDLCTPPVTAEGPQLQPDPMPSRLSDRRGGIYQLRRVPGRNSIQQLRWCRLSNGHGSCLEQTTSLREVIAQLETYEPALELTYRALAAHQEDAGLSTVALRAELFRVVQSPIVLNRKLREIVVAIVAREKISMSEIAVRCGRIKRDCKGNESGETSWLARRLGILPDGGGGAPTPWIHSEVLGLIARRGLGLSPREVEV